MEEWAFKQYFAGAIIDEETGQALEYRDLINYLKHRDTWQTFVANEIGYLSQGIRELKRTDTIFLYQSQRSQKTD